jgi:hypothetical protein
VVEGRLGLFGREVSGLGFLFGFGEAGSEAEDINFEGESLVAPFLCGLETFGDDSYVFSDYLSKILGCDQTFEGLHACVKEAAFHEMAHGFGRSAGFLGSVLPFAPARGEERPLGPDLRPPIFGDSWSRVKAGSQGQAMLVEKGPKRPPWIVGGGVGLAQRHGW